MDAYNANKTAKPEQIGQIEAALDVFPAAAASFSPDTTQIVS